MKKIMLITTLVISFAINAQKLTTESGFTNDVIQHFDSQDSKRLASMHQNAMIKSQEDLNFFSKLEYKNFPLNYLATKEKANFLKSLTFNEKGLTGFDMSILKHLESNEINKILSMFGFGTYSDSIKNPQDGIQIKGPGGNTSKDFLEDFKCESRGTCDASTNHACTSNC